MGRSTSKAVLEQTANIAVGAAAKLTRALILAVLRLLLQPFRAREAQGGKDGFQSSPLIVVDVSPAKRIGTKF